MLFLWLFSRFSNLICNIQMLILLWCTDNFLWHTQFQIHSKCNDTEKLLLTYKAHYNFEHHLSNVFSAYRCWVCGTAPLPLYTWEGRCNCWQCWDCLNAIEYVERKSRQVSYEQYEHIRTEWQYEFWAHMRKKLTFELLTAMSLHIKNIIK